MKKMLLAVLGVVISAALLLGSSTAFAGHPYGSYGNDCDVSRSEVIVHGPYGPERRTAESVTCRNGYHHYRYNDGHGSYKYRRSGYYDRGYHRNRHYRDYRRGHRRGYRDSSFHLCVGGHDRRSHLNLCIGR